MLKLLCQEDGQLVRNVSHSGICSVTPDGFGVLYCSNVLSSSFPDKNKLLSFIETEKSSGYANDIASGGIMMTSLEHKHKSSIMTISKCQSILETDLNGTRVKVLNLDDINDRHLFKKAIPSVDYRCQVIHESVTAKTPCTVFTVATTAIEYVLIVLV